MAFNSSNYVAPSSNGQYVAMVGGQPHYYDSQAAAEQGYNSLTQPSAAAPATDPNAMAQYTNVSLEQLQASQAEFAAQMAYNQKRLEMIDLPTLQLNKDQAAMQAAMDAANAVMQGVNAQAAVQQALIGAGNYDLSRGQFAMGIGSQGLQQEQQRQQGLQTAAGAVNQEAMGALNLEAQLRGPSNAFQQQAVDEGLNAQGLSNGIAAIAGQYSQPMFQAPQSTPEAATLGTMARDMIEAGGQSGQLTPTQQAYNSALSTMNAPSWTQLAGSYLAPLTNDSNSIWSQTANVSGAGGKIDPTLAAVEDAANQQYQFAYGTNGGGTGALNQAVTSGSYAPAQMPAQQNPSQFGFSGAPGTTPSAQAQATSFGGSQPNYGQAGSYLSGGTRVPGGSSMQPLSASGPGYYAPGGYGYNASLAALPNPNQINIRNWNKLNPDSQQFLLSGYNAKGYSNNDVLGTIQNAQLPYQAPTFGQIY